MRGKFVFALLSMFCISSSAAGSAVASDVDERQELSRQIAQLPNAAARSKSDGQHKIFLHFRLLELTGNSLAEWKRALPDVETDPTLPTAKADQLLQTLRAAGGLKMVADPTLITTIGRKASMFNGGTFPILLPSNDDRMKSERREFGVRCSALPMRADEAGKLQLDVQITCSEPDSHNTVTAADGRVVPGLTSTRVTTRVTLGQDETLRLGGCQRKYEGGSEGTKAVAAENLLVFLVSLHSGDEVDKSAPAASQQSR
jgi:Flp pilus assembly secretin CpaC